jgi:hypothetical protein
MSTFSKVYLLSSQSRRSFILRSHNEGSDLSVGQGHRGSSQWAGGGGSAEDSLAMKLHHFLASLTKSRGFYANLAESLCSDESFAETRDTADCWNGQRIGE